MPQRILIDSIVVQYRDNYTIFDTIGYYASVFSTQKPGALHYYRIEIEVNGVTLNDGSSLWLYEESRAADIYKMTVPYTLNIGDEVVVSVYSLSSSVYEYFSGLSKQFMSKYSNVQPPLINPNGNITPSALGCFQASSVIRSRFVVDGSTHKVVMVSK